MTKVLVFGASGELGQLICRELIRQFVKGLAICIADYKRERGIDLAGLLGENTRYCFADIRDKENIDQLIGTEKPDIVIVALQQKEPVIQKLCILHRALCLDVTVFFDFVNEVRKLDELAQSQNIGSIVMTGLFPGLSGLLVKKAVSLFDEVEEVNVGLLQSTNARAGKSGIIDMLNIVNQEVLSHQFGQILPGFTVKRTMHFLEPRKEIKVRLINHGESNILCEKLGLEKVSYWTAWDHEGFNTVIYALKRLGLIKALLCSKHKSLLTYIKHNPKRHENASLSIEAKGRINEKRGKKTIILTTFSDYHTTAMFTAALAKLTVKKKVTGVVTPFEITNLDEMLTLLDCQKIIVKLLEE